MENWKRWTEEGSGGCAMGKVMTHLGSTMAVPWARDTLHQTGAWDASLRCLPLESEDRDPGRSGPFGQGLFPKGWVGRRWVPRVTREGEQGCVSPDPQGALVRFWPGNELTPLFTSLSFIPGARHCSKGRARDDSETATPFCRKANGKSERLHSWFRTHS